MIIQHTYNCTLLHSLHGAHRIFKHWQNLQSNLKKSLHISTPNIIFLNENSKKPVDW